MLVRIFEQRKDVLLDAVMLARVVRRDGFVVFCAGRLPQRRLAARVSKLLAETGTAINFGEARSPNRCMCIADNTRYDLEDVLVEAARIDFLNQKRDFRNAG